MELMEFNNLDFIILRNYIAGFFIEKFADMKFWKFYIYELI